MAWPGCKSPRPQSLGTLVAACSVETGPDRWFRVHPWRSGGRICALRRLARLLLRSIRRRRTGPGPSGVLALIGVPFGRGARICALLRPSPWSQARPGGCLGPRNGGWAALTKAAPIGHAGSRGRVGGLRREPSVSPRGGGPLGRGLGVSASGQARGVLGPATGVGLPFGGSDRARRQRRARGWPSARAVGFTPRGGGCRGLGDFGSVRVSTRRCNRACRCAAVVRWPNAR